MTKRDAIVALAARPCGASSAEIQAEIRSSAAAVATHLIHLELQKRVVRAKRAGNKLRWFANVADRDTWQNAVPTGISHNTIKAPKLVAIGEKVPGDKARTPTNKLQLMTLEGSRANIAGIPAIPRAMRAPRLAVDFGVIVPSHVKVSACPSWTHDPRYQCRPGEQPFGAGFSAVGVGRDIQTGRAWQ